MKVERKVKIIVTISVVLLTGVFSVVIMRPCILKFHKEFDATDKTIGGEVYKWSNEKYLIVLHTNTALILDRKKLELRLLNKNRPKGMKIGDYFITSERLLSDINLTRSESFTPQRPLIENGTVIFSDPLKQNGKVEFTLE